MSLQINQVAKKLLTFSTQEVSNYRKYRQQSGQDFNIFKLLDRHTSEVKGHSAFIADFLSPKGTHGQGDAFLKLFFKSVGIEEEVKSFDTWRVQVEEGKDVDGRIDILLVGENSDGERFGITIENKIYAGLQKRQLGRYYEFLESNFGEKNGGQRWLLFYLTLNGDEPSKDSLIGIPGELIGWGLDNDGDEGEGEESATDSATTPEEPVRLLSYSEEICEWMAQCREKLSSLPYAREVVSQYIETINLLTGNGGSMPSELMKELNSPEKFEAAIQLAKASKLARIKLVQSIWDDIKTSWNDMQRQSLARAENSAAFVGSLEPNFKAKAETEKLKGLTKNFFEKEKLSTNKKYFGLSSKSYFYVSPSGEKQNVWLEIRFNGRFYVGLYGENDVCIHTKEVLEKFYGHVHKEYDVPDKKKLGKLKGLGRPILYLNKDVDVDFRKNNESFYRLMNETNRNDFANKLVAMAGVVIKEMSLMPLDSISKKEEAV